MTTPQPIMPNPNKPSASVVYVTPELAERWLGKNVKNRNLKTNKIKDFTRDMVAGKWQITGEAIKFDINDHMIDGQNRCHAVISSGVTVPMFVVRGLAPGAQEVMDTGASRSRSDALGLRGYKNTKAVAAVAKTYSAYISGTYKTALHQGEKPLTNSEALELLEEHPGLVDAANRAAALRRTLRLSTGSIGTGIYVLTEIDVDDSMEFFDRIANLRTYGKGDPINTLLKRASEVTEARTRFWSSTALFFLFRSWNAYRAGEQLTKFQIGSASHGWVSIPEPK